jgi:hypothetical protein
MQPAPDALERRLLDAPDASSMTLAILVQHPTHFSAILSDQVERAFHFHACGKAAVSIKTARH